MHTAQPVTPTTPAIDFASLPVVDEPRSNANFTHDEAVAPIHQRNDRLPVRANQRLAVRLTGRGGGPHMLPQGGAVGGNGPFDEIVPVYSHQLPILLAEAATDESRERETIARNTWISRAAKECRALVKSAIAEDATITDKQFRAVVDQWDAWTPRQRENALGAARKIGTVEDAAIRILGRTETSPEAVHYELFECSRPRFDVVEVVGRLGAQEDPRQTQQAQVLQPMLENQNRLVEALAGLAGIKGKASK